MGINTPPEKMEDQETLESLRAELDRLRQHFDEELERQKIEALAEFAAGAGHEINNPLAIIGGHVQLLLREIENREHRRQLAVIGAQVKRAYEMIADIRLFARPPKPEIQRFDLTELLRKLAAEQTPLAEELGIRLEVIDEKSVREIETDPVQLHVVLSVLCNNAREIQSTTGQSTACGAIRIQVRDIDSKRHENPETDCGTLEISVEDEGPGVAPEIRPLIFCPYFSGRQAGRGLGFGLPKAWRIMQQLGGSIRHEIPDSGRGARFVVVIPSSCTNPSSSNCNQYLRK